MGNIVIGIEGYVGTGKTSVCKELLDKIPNSVLLHGGNIYRAITYGILKTGLINVKEDNNKLSSLNIKNIMDKLKLRIEIENRESVVYVDGKKIDEEKLQSEDSSLAVSIAGANADSEKFYAFARHLINMYSQEYNVIVSGRDLMRIYPNLNYHFFITASLEERIRRKMSQYGKNSDYEEVKQNIVKRDELQEKAGYYTIYDNTIKVDVTDCKTVEKSTMRVLKHIKEYN